MASVSSLFNYTQNHGFLVDYESIDQTNLRLLMFEFKRMVLLKGIRTPSITPSSVFKFNPDAAPGPHDATHFI